MKIVVARRKRVSFGAADFHTPITRYRTLLRAGAHGNTCASVGPIRVQNLKAIRALESAYNRYPHLPWALWENRKYHNCGPGARTMIFSHPSKLFYRSTFWKKNWLAATAGAENHAFGGFHTPPTNALKVWENATFAKSPGTYCKVMSSAQEHLSVICAKSFGYKWLK